MSSDSFEQERTKPLAVQAGVPKLLDVRRGVAHALEPGRCLVIGRDASADIVVVSDSASRRHASIELIGSMARVAELGSSNGTWVDGKPVQVGSAATLQPGQTLRVGDVMMLFHHAEVVDKVLPASRASGGDGPVIVAESMKRLYLTLERLAQGPISVLILGETGVGKEVAARTIHQRSPRCDGPFIAINCPAVPASLLESELFGHEKGAFTGADSAKPGQLELADGGTVFLDEVGELPLVVQAKLLRVLEERAITRVGGKKSIPIDVRFVSATNRDLVAESQQGRFRQDLYFRLNGVTVTVPALRERGEEIEPLARHHLQTYSELLGRAVPALSADALGKLQLHDWPGNIRELRNVIERATLMCDGSIIEAADLALEPAIPDSSQETIRTERKPAPPAPAPSSPAPLSDAVQEFERQRILDALESCAGNQTRAAELLGLSRRGLTKKLDKYGIPRPQKN